MPGIGDSTVPMRSNPSASADCATSSDDTLPHVVVSHDAALADFGAAGLELRLHQDDHVAAGVEERWDDREDETQRDERHVDRDDGEDARVWWKLIGSQRSRVHALDDGHSRVAAQLPIELAVADVEGDHAPRAALEEHVGESARRGADVQPEPFAHVDAKDVQRMGELDPASADVLMIGTVNRHLGVGGNVGPRFGDREPVDSDLAGQDQGARPLARRGEAAVNDEHVEPDLVLQFVRETIQRAIAAS